MRKVVNYIMHRYEIALKGENQNEYRKYSKLC